MGMLHVLVQKWMRIREVVFFRSLLLTAVANLLFCLFLCICCRYLSDSMRGLGCLGDLFTALMGFSRYWLSSLDLTNFVRCAGYLWLTASNLEIWEWKSRNHEICECRHLEIWNPENEKINEEKYQNVNPFCRSCAGVISLQPCGQQ